MRVLTCDDSYTAQVLASLAQGKTLPITPVLPSALLATANAFLQAPLYDDFQSARTVTNPGAGTVVTPGIGETNFTLITVGISAGTPWGIKTGAAPSGAIGIGRLQTGGNATVASICRGLSATDVTVCRVRDIQRLDFLVSLAAQDSLTSGLFHFMGINANWASLSGVMGLQRQIATGPNWVLRRSGVADLDTGVDAASTAGPWFVRFEQKQDPNPPAGELGLGTGQWDLYIASPSSPTLDTPIVADFAGGAAGGVPTTATNYGAQVQKFAAAGVQSALDIDWISFTPFAQTFEQRIQP